MSASSDVELRGPAPREVVDVIDAISSARRQSRMELVNEVLAAWSADRKREAEAIQRVTRGDGGTQ